MIGDGRSIMSRELPTPAPWIADLPCDARGFPAPAEAGWESGKPILSKVATDRKVALGLRRACAVCGYEIPKDTTVYRAFAQGDAAHMRQHERERSHDLGGPVHLSCILYSAMACPYLRERNSRLGKESEISPGARRGTRAAIIGFQDFGLLIPAHPHAFLDPEQPPPHFSYQTMVEDIGYRDGAELAERYEAAIVTDALLIDTSRPRHYWTDSAADVKALGKALHSDFAELSKRQPMYQQIIEGLGRYVSLPV
jgi:hypothetical protein